MDVYDYIIVGAGSAGCALAGRLSEDPSARVLLVEAGGKARDPRIQTPGMAPTLWRTRYDWTYFTAPEPGLGGRCMHWPRGKGLGGSSAINYMIYMRGHRDNYDAWADEGNAGWSYDDVLPYFKRSENQSRGADDFHGVGGPLSVSDVEASPMSDLLVAAAREVLDLPFNNDFNGARQDGAGRFQLTRSGGRRCSAAVAFLEPARGRPNLTVLTHAQATRLLVENGRVVGVQVRRGKVERSLRAESEVVLAAGAVGSPELLLRSGIGSADELRALGIEVQLDLKGVGKNLMDHVAAPMITEDRAGITGDVRPANLLRWLGEHVLRGTGPMASTAAEAGAFVRTSAAHARPDVQFHFLPVGSPQKNFDDAPFNPVGHAFTLIPTLLYPHSRGQVRLQSSDASIKPVIEPRYFDDARDLETLVEGVRMGQAILGSRLLDACRGTHLSPLCDTTDPVRLRDEVRERCTTLFHPVGTCKMGLGDDAVVDPELRVHGMAGLRIADASIMPSIVGGNTNAPCIMVGERGADLIRGRAEMSRARPVNGASKPPTELRVPAAE